MDVEIFALCDAATDTGGKLNLLGAFDRINARQFPLVHPHCAIALRLRFDRIEEGEHQVKINIIDADGAPVIPGIDGKIGIKFRDDMQSLCANLVFNMNGLKLESPGSYAIELALDGRYEKSLPLAVAEIPANGGQGPAQGF